MRERDQFSIQGVTLLGKGYPRSLGLFTPALIVLIF